MITLKNLGRFRKGRIWTNEAPELEYETIEVLRETVDVTSLKRWDEKNLIFELSLPRNSSNYALLGLKYIPDNEKVLKVEIKVGRSDDVLLENNIAQIVDEVHVGIPEEYARAILEYTKENSKEIDVPPGTLMFDVGAHGYVGSSQAIFLSVTKILLNIIDKDLKSISEDELSKIINESI